MRAEPTGSAAPDFSALDPCVHCGFCLPACPTYLATGDESDSPRGRIVLMRALERGELGPADGALVQHLDACLGCRGCEPVCPSGVGYGRGLEAAREILARERGLPRRARVILAVFRQNSLWRPLFTAARWLRGTRIPAALSGTSGFGFQMGMLAATQSAARTVTLEAQQRRRGPGPYGTAIRSLARMASAPLRRGLPAARVPAGMMPPGPTSLRPPEPTRSPEQTGAGEPSGAPVTPVASAAPRRAATVALFRGCVMDTLFSHVNQATKRTLEANGYEVVEVESQGCCGALHEHAGDRASAERLAAENVAAFADSADFVVVNSAGCGALLKDYGHLLGDEAAESFAAKVRDVSELLAEAGPRPGAPLELDVAYDAPCHLQHAQRVHEAPLAVLRAIPGLRLRLVPDADKCCGSAGVYSLLQPAMSRAVLDNKVAAVAATSPRPAVVATGNPGCLMQIGAGLRAAGLDIGVAHPVELLDRSYAEAGLYGATPLYLQACTPPSSSTSTASSSTTSRSTATH